MAVLGIPTEEELKKNKKKLPVLGILEEQKIKQKPKLPKPTLFHSTGAAATATGRGFLKTTEGLADFLEYRVADLMGLLGAKKTKENIIKHAKFDATSALVGDAKKFYEPKSIDTFKEGGLGSSIAEMTGGIGALIGMGGLGKAAKLNPKLPVATSFIGGATSEALQKGHDYDKSKEYGALQGVITTALYSTIGGKTVALGNTPANDFLYDVSRKVIANPKVRYYATQFGTGYLAGFVSNFANTELKNKLLDEDNKFNFSEANKNAIVTATVNAITSFAGKSYEKYYDEMGRKLGSNEAIQLEKTKDGNFKPGRVIKDLNERVSNDGGLGVKLDKGPNVYISPKDFPKNIETMPKAQTTPQQSLLPNQQQLLTTKNDIMKNEQLVQKTPTLPKLNEEVVKAETPKTNEEIYANYLEKNMPLVTATKPPKTDDPKIRSFYENPQQIVEQAKNEGKFDPKLVNEIRKNPKEVKDLIATKISMEGKPSLAIRGSGVYAPKEFETFDFKDIKGFAGQQSYNFLAAAGEFDNISLEKAGKTGNWGPMKRMQYDHDKTLSEKALFVTEQSNKFQNLAKKYGIPINKKTGEKLFEILDELETKDKVQASDSNMIKLAKDIRLELDDLRKQTNEVRKSLGKKEMGYIKAYIPHMVKTKAWNILINDNKTRISEQFDFIIPNEKFNPRVIKRIPGSNDWERNAWKVLDSYIYSISNDIYISPLIEQTKAINSVIMNKYPNMSNFLNSYIKENLVGQSAKLDSAFGVKAGTKRKMVLSKISMARNVRALSGNFIWTITTQPASIANTFARAGGITKGGQNTIGGLMDYATNKEIKAKVDKLPSMIIKSKGMNVGKTVGGDIDRLATRISESKLDKFNDFLSIIGDEMENYLTGASAAAAYRHGKQIGLTGEDLDMYADMVAQNTQSMYNKEARPIMMNNQSFRAMFPFQTYSFEMYRYAKQLMGKGGGIPIEKAKRLSQAIMLMVATGLYGMYLKKIWGKSLSKIGQFIPVAGGIVEDEIGQFGETMGLKKREFLPAKSPVAPLEDINSIRNSIDAVVRYQNYQPMIKELTSWGMGLGGVGGASQVNRFIDGFIASQRGYQTTKSGRVAFPVAGDVEKVKSMIVGPYSTKYGKKYVEGGFKPLGDKQSDLFKALPTKEAIQEFETIQKKREYNRLTKELKKLQETGKDTSKIERKIQKLLEEW